MAEIPNLAGIATADLVDQIGAGSFKASYINWSRTMHLLRDNAPGWLPELAKTDSGSILWEAPVGVFLMIYFRHTDGTCTPAVPQAIMDTRNAAVPTSKITARDITDTHRRGVCMAAALTFGLAYELWAKVALESGYGGQPEKPERGSPGVSETGRVSPSDGVWDGMTAEQTDFLTQLAEWVTAEVEGGRIKEAAAYIRQQGLTAEEETAMWTLLDSKVRTPLKKEMG